MRRYFLLLMVLAACSRLVETAPDATLRIPVEERFLQAYVALGEERTLGAPISRGFEVENGRFVQYFERMRLDMAADGTVVPYPLGRWAYEGVNQIAVVAGVMPTNARSRTFASGEQVFDAFLAFYDAYDGVRLLGEPISPQFEEGGVWTQYFENGRLEWHPALPVGQRVQLGLLGQAHFQNEMAGLYEAQNFRPGSSAGLPEAEVKAAVAAPILYAGDVQVLHVMVTTVDALPATDIRLQAIVSYDDGREQVVTLQPTDGEGYSRQKLVLDGAEPGQAVLVRVEALGSNNQAIGVDEVVFKTWW